MSRFDQKLAAGEGVVGTFSHLGGPAVAECLSLSGLYGIVKRPMKVKVKAQDRHGNPVEYEREGITARCFCHEIEHLDGHMYYEKAGRLFTEDEVDEMLQKAEEEEN